MFSLNCTTMAREFVPILVHITIFIYCTDAFDNSNIQKDINYINSVQSSWKAEYNPMSKVDLKVWRKKLGIKLIPEKLNMLKRPSMNTFLFASKSKKAIKLPKNYDTRKAWPACKRLVSRIRDQSICGSCWAVASASVLSDRFCIFSGGKYNQPLSAEDMMRCCARCKNKSGNGCEGGDIFAAMFHLKYEGIVTGGEYNSEEGCIPYSFKPCTSSNGSNKEHACAYAGNEAKTEKCRNVCSNSKYEIPYNRDKFYIQDAYLIPNNESLIKWELKMNGSCLATMKVYEDFVHYKSGIYHYIEGKPLGEHGVRLMGWGSQKGVEYWLVANSWGESWGEKGFFRIHRTENKCDFGKYIISLIPD